jgi:hypothetical protein
MAVIDCLTELAADVLKDCAEQPVKGLEKVAYVYNRKNVDVTYDVTDTKLITALVPKSGFQGYMIQGFNLDMNAGHSIVVSDNLPDKYLQTFNFAAWLLDSAQTQELDGLQDILVVVESKNKNVAGSGDGTFKAYGVETGLYKSADDHTANDNNGSRLVALTNRAEQESTVSSHVVLDTDYATTLTMLEASLVATP